MTKFNSYYEILALDEHASASDIKSAYRKLAHQYHPDKHGNSPASNAAFVLLSNAYNTLSDPLKRKEYDTYLRSSTALKSWTSSHKSALPGLSSGSSDALLNQFNVLLWDIEDIIIARAKWGRDSIRQEKIMRRYILAILSFIDKWVLTVAGFPDYILDARKMKRLDPLDYNNTLGLKDQGHLPFVSISDYFYNIRKRMDKFLSKVRVQDFLLPVSGVDITLLDCIMEVQNYVIHYLSYLAQVQQGKLEGIPVFAHSQGCFEE